MHKCPLSQPISVRIIRQNLWLPSSAIRVDFIPPFAYLSEARRMGLTILPLAINTSDWAYRGIGMTLCLGFMQLKGLERAFMTRLLEERQHHGSYRSFQDFLTRLNPEPTQTRLLILAGCFDAIAGEITRPGLLWRLYANHPVCGLSPHQSAVRQATPLLPTSPTLPIPNDYATERKVQHEIQLFGFPLQCHPLTLYAQYWSHLNLIPAIEMHAHIGKQITMVGWLINEKPAVTKHGQSMAFLTLEDTTELYDTTLVSRCISAIRAVTHERTPIVTPREGRRRVWSHHADHHPTSDCRARGKAGSYSVNSLFADTNKHPFVFTDIERMIKPRHNHDQEKQV